jgi:hypothetical protein
VGRGMLLRMVVVGVLERRELMGSLSGVCRRRGMRVEGGVVWGVGIGGVGRGELMFV